MAKYMVQSMEYGTHGKIVYYRKQSSGHVSHTESGRFTQDAKAAYALAKGVTADLVEEGSYRSNQGVPGDRNAEEI